MKRRLISLFLALVLIGTLIPAGGVAFAEEAPPESVSESASTDSAGTADSGSASSDSDASADTASGDSADSDSAGAETAGPSDADEPQAGEAASESSYPAQNFKDEINDVTVQVDAPEGALPEDTEMVLSEVVDEVAQNAAVAATGDENAEPVAAVAISFFSDGEEVEPQETVEVTMESELFEEEDLSLVEVPDKVEEADVVVDADVNSAAPVDVEEAKVDIDTDAGTVQFESAEPAVYVIVGQGEAAAEEPAPVEEELVAEEPAPVEEELAAEEPAPVEVKLTATAEDGMTVFVTATSDVIPEGSSVTVSVVENTELIAALIGEQLADESKTITNLAAYDVTILDAEGNEIQPEGSVSVLFRNAGVTGDDVKVFHVEGDVDEPEAAKEVDTDLTIGNIQAFTTDGFSIYVVVTGADPDARLTVNFWNLSVSDEDPIAVMSITQNQLATELETNIYDPGVGELSPGEVFKGWTTIENYTPADAEDPMNIDDVRTLITTMLEAGTVEDGDEIDLYALVFESYHVSYLDELRTTIRTDEVLYKAGDAEVPYTVQYTYTPYYVAGSNEDDEDETANFAGWLQLVPEKSPAPVYQNGTEIDLSSDVVLVAEVEYGHWLIFNQNGAGATYTAPLFIETNATPNETGMPTPPTRTGYSFDGWYTNSACTVPFDGDEKIEDSTFVFAKWVEDQETSFTVLVWEESLNGGYDFVKSIKIENAETGANMSEVISGQVGDYTVQVSGEDIFIGLDSADDPEHTANPAFLYKEYEANNGGVVTADGTSVLNIYFERKTYTLKFYYARYTNRWQIARNGDYSWVNTSNNFTPAYIKTGAGALTTGTDTVGDGQGGTFYYAQIQAKYGADISSLWPAYGDFADRTTPNSNAGTNEYLNSWILMPGAKAITGSGGGRTVKGRLSVMDEQVLGDLTKSEGYVIAQYNNQPNEYTYYIYFEAQSGDAHDRQYGGKWYTLHETIPVRSGSDYGSQHAPSYKGYDPAGSENNGVNSRTGREIYYYYDPLSYSILFMDGLYEKGNKDFIQNKSENTLGSVEAPFRSDISGYEDYIVPAWQNERPDYVFLGWFADSECTTPYPFTTTEGDETISATMPEGGVTVYAKWVLKEYMVTLHPNENGDSTFVYINGNKAGHYTRNPDDPETAGSDTFWIDNGEEIGNVGGSRDLYDLMGWFTNSKLTKVWDFDAFEMNDTIVSKYGELYETDGTDSRYDPAYPSTVGEINLYASWRKILDGADGIEVVYTATGKDDDGNVVEGTNAPTDGNKYSDQAQAIAYQAAVAPDGSGLSFQYWVVQTWDESSQTYTDSESSQTVLPGDRYKVDYEDARMVVTEWRNADGDTSATYDPENFNIINKATYTIQLRAHYAAPGNATPTHIHWYDNYTNGPTGILHEDNDLAINQTVEIQDAPTREKYTFLGWAREEEMIDDQTVKYTYPDLTADDLFLTYDSATGNYTYKTNSGTVKTAESVFADEKLPYYGMYAVWAPAYWVEIKGSTVDKPYTGSQQETDDTAYTITYHCGDTVVDAAALETAGITVNVTGSGDNGGTTAPKAVGTNVGTYTTAVTVTLVLNDGSTAVLDETKYTASADVVLHIKKIPMTLTVTDYNAAYDGAAHTVSVSASAGGTAITPTYYYSTVDPESEGFDEENGWSTTAPTWTDVTAAQTVYVMATMPNYEDAYASGTVTITKAPLTITTGGGSKTYDGDPLTNATATISGLVNGETATVTATGSRTDVGSSQNTYSLTWGTAKESNYEITTETLGDLTVNPAVVTVTANDASKTYGENDPTFTASVTGLVGSDTVVYTMTRDSGEDAGTYDITPSGAVTQGNYTVNYAKGVFTINPKAVTLTANSDTTKFYNGSEQTVTGYTSSVEGLTFADTVVASGSGTNVGNYDVTFSGVTVNETTDTTGNYVVTAVVPGTLKINPVAVTITAADASKFYDESDPDFEDATMDGAVGTELDGIDLSVVRSNTDEAVGVYDDVLSIQATKETLETTYPNYTFTITPADFTIYGVVSYVYTDPVPDDAPEAPAAVGYVKDETVTVADDDAFTATGYTFSGWTTADADVAEDGTFTMPLSNVTFTGSFTINTYTVTYIVDGTQYGEVESYEYGAAVTARAEPTKEGYTFSGWSEIPATMPAENVTVTGSFTINTYTVTYIVDGAQYGEVESYEYGAAVTARTEPTKEGYTFSGWSEIPATMPAENVTVTGSFTANTYTVKFDANEGDGEMDDQTFTYNEAQDLTANAFTRKGWVFDHWNTEADGTGTDYADKENVINLTAVPGGEITLYAQWEVDVIGPDTDGDGEPDPDGIPDKYQVLVKYEADANGSITGETFEVFTAEKDADGKYAGTVDVTSTGTTAEANEGYVLENWTNDQNSDTSDDGVFAFGMVAGGETITITANFAEDVIGPDTDGDGEPDPDGIPDKYQVVVRYTVVHGTWNDGTATKISVLNKLDADGNYAEDGTAVLGDGIPDTGSVKPDNNYKTTGKWDTEPTAETVVGEDTTYTYTLEKKSSGGGGGGSNPKPDNPPAPDLNTEDHYAYVLGYPDGTVRPNGSITRAESATVIYRLLTDSRRDEILTASNSFSDVTVDLWYNKAVSSMEKGNYVLGYPDGTFGGDRSITRAEFSAILVRFFGTNDASASFTDVDSSHWAYRYIATAASYGWLEGYPDGTFRPDQPITRAEVMTLINRILNRGVNEESQLGDFTNFPDNVQGAWYYYEIIEAVNDHEYTGTRPNENWSRNACDRVYDVARYEQP